MGDCGSPSRSLTNAQSLCLDVAMWNHLIKSSRLQWATFSDDPATWCIYPLLHRKPLTLLKDDQPQLVLVDCCLARWLEMTTYDRLNELKWPRAIQDKHPVMELNEGYWMNPFARPGRIELAALVDGSGLEQLQWENRPDSSGWDVVVGEELEANDAQRLVYAADPAMWDAMLAMHSDLMQDQGKQRTHDSTEAVSLRLNELKRRKQELLDALQSGKPVHIYRYTQHVLTVDPERPELELLLPRVTWTSLQLKTQKVLADLSANDSSAPLWLSSNGGTVGYIRATARDAA